nr:hypothetical protein [uncultured Arsenicibacter sp.]
MTYTNEQIAELKTKVSKILAKNLPRQVTIELWNNPNKIVVFLFTGLRSINNPTMVSFVVENDLNVQFQHFGGEGGQNIFRETDPNNPKERFHAMGGEKIPFRKPKKTEAAVLKAIEKIPADYLATMRGIVARGLQIERFSHSGSEKEGTVDYSFLG